MEKTHLVQPNLDNLTVVAESVASSFGVHILEVKVGQQGRRHALEVTIYRQNGRISLDDCERVSRKLEEVLDQQEPPLIDSSFLLEVQSPGLDRKLSGEREFAIFSGQPVEVKTKQKVDGLGSAFTGKLLGLDNGRVRVAQPQKLSDAGVSKSKMHKSAPKAMEDVPDPVEVELSNVIHVRLQPDFIKDIAESELETGCDGDENGEV